MQVREREGTIELHESWREPSPPFIAVIAVLPLNRCIFIILLQRLLGFLNFSSPSKHSPCPFLTVLFLTIDGLTRLWASGPIKY